MAEARGIAALIVAAGTGDRARAVSPVPKQFSLIGGKSVLQRAIDAFARIPRIDAIHVVIGPGQRTIFDTHVESGMVSGVYEGGPTRQASVHKGLTALGAAPPRLVLIHDAARPFAAPKLIERVIDGLENAEAVIPTRPVTDTLKRVTDGDVAETVARTGLETAQTPQGFAYARIVEAHDKAAREGKAFTDDAAVAEWTGMTVRTVAGERENTKLTTPDDFADAEARLALNDVMHLGDVRVGVGYDVHPLGAGGEVWLGGVAIPHTRGLVGHSDADVILHALTDAILGALGDGDIGQHFPPSDDRWKGGASSLFLADAVARVRARGGVVSHLDATYVGEGPKIAPHREAIRARIAEIAGISADRVGIKATTNEGMGFIGRGEGAAAHAVATIRLPLTP